MDNSKIICLYVNDNMIMAIGKNDLVQVQSSTKADVISDYTTLLDF